MYYVHSMHLKKNDENKDRQVSRNVKCVGLCEASTCFIFQDCVLVLFIRDKLNIDSPVNTGGGLSRFNTFWDVIENCRN